MQQHYPFKISDVLTFAFDRMNVRLQKNKLEKTRKRWGERLREIETSPALNLKYDSSIFSTVQPAI